MFGNPRPPLLLLPFLFSPSLYGQLELLPLDDLLVVDPEEVAVEDGLDEAGDDGDPVDLVVGALGEVAPDPVGDVEGAVEAQGEQVVGGDDLGLAGALQHEELRQDGHRLEPDGEGPRHLPRRPVVGEQHPERRRPAQQVLHPERVQVRVRRRLVPRRHQVHHVALRRDEEDLEQDVVQALGAEEIW